MSASAFFSQKQDLETYQQSKEIEAEVREMTPKQFTEDLMGSLLEMISKAMINNKPATV